MGKLDLQQCARRGCRKEWHDEGPLCEKHFGEVELGRALRGDYGDQEEREALGAVCFAGLCAPEYAEISRLVRLANRYSPK